MACDDKISNLCGNKTYAACVDYEGIVNSQSDLSGDECLSIEETTQDIYNQLEDLSNRVGGNPVIGTVVSVNDVDPDEDGNVEIDTDDVPQGSTNLYATAAEKATWNGKQDALGFTPVPDARSVNGFPLSSDVALDKSDIGLGNVQNVDTTDPNNIVQDSTHRFVTDAEKAIWNNPPTNSIVEVPYLSLLNLKTNSLLIKDKVYLITDYETTYTQPVTLASKSSGVIEPIYVIATDVNKLHNVGRSKLYPQDIIFYEITGDIGNGAGTEGFTKGKIYRRVDTLANNDIGTDWRHVKYDRLGVDTLLFEDYANTRNNVIKEATLTDSVVGANFLGNTIGVGFLGNTIGDNCNDNIIKDDFRDNTLGNIVTNNVIGSNFMNNVTADNFRDNVITNYFTNNTLGTGFIENNIKNNFNNNTIGSDFSSNIIDDDFASNIIGNFFVTNIVANSFFTNTVVNFLTNTIIKQNVTNVNFTTADVYGKAYSTLIERKSNNTFQYSYTDGFGDIVTENL